MKRNKEIKQQHADKSKQPLPKDKPATYWHGEKTDSSKMKTTPQREREKREMNEESLEVEPKLKKQSHTKPASEP